jgi:hypothetical protein
MPDPKSRARVQRLLSGVFRPDDLTGLFLYARDHCDGRESVAEIGHFVAHHNERDRGIVTRSTREWFATARFHMFRFHDSTRDLDPNRMPSATPDYLRIRRGIGRKGAREFQVLNDLADRLLPNPDGTWRLPALTHAEASLLQAVCSVLVSKPAFEADRLCSDFFATLKSNGLIVKNELAQHKESFSVLIKLYAISVMHNCVVQVGDGTKSQLRARAEQKSRTISVSAGVPDTINPSNITLASPMFYMNADPADHCHPELLIDSDWDFEIELNENRQLARLA